MKNIIYQYWDGPLLPGVTAGSECMKDYAGRIGAEYRFELNPRFRTDLGNFSPHYGQFKVVYDTSFDEYDNILFADTDVFPIEGLTNSIFEEFNSHIGVCEETYQPKARLTSVSEINSNMDNKWSALMERTYGCTMPRTVEGLPKVYNSGVVMYSKEGRKLAQKHFRPFQEYVQLIRNNGISNFYTADQNYLHAMMLRPPIEYSELNNDWNAFIHYIGDASMSRRPVNDMRTDTTKFVHIQLRTADHYDAKKLWNITNLKNIEDWKIY